MDIDIGIDLDNRYSILDIDIRYWIYNEICMYIDIYI